MFDLDDFSLETAFYRRLSNQQSKKLHHASLEILERTGIRFYDEPAVELLRKGGARVSDGNRVSIPSRLVEWALRTAPKQIILYNQSGEPAIRLSGRKAYYGNGSDLPYIIDHRTGVRRKAVLQDAVEGVRVLESLPDIDFIMSFILPSDMPAEQAELYQMQAMLANTTKPIVYVATNLERTQQVVAMCEVLAGGTDALRDYPFAACYINISAPLRHNAESIQKLLWLAEKGLPAIYRPSIVTRGITTPITIAGFIATNNASQLAGLVLSQLKREGAPFIRCSHGGSTFDMRTMCIQLASPEARGFNADLAHWYGLPSFGIGGVSGAKTVDQQAALEASLTLLLAALSGEQLIHDVGHLDNAATASLEQVVICHEIIGWIKQFLPGLNINADTLALDLIHEVGPDGQFLEMEHTAIHCRDDWYPELLDRQSYEDWANEGSPTLRSRAKRKVDEILAAYTPRPIPKEIERAWTKIIGLESIRG